MTEFLSGVIEGFYGRPWTKKERFQLFNWMDAWGLNTYVYAPKDDLKLRAMWRELYGEDELRMLYALAARCSERDIAFVYTLSPGLSIRYADEQDLWALKEKVQQLVEGGVDHFCLLFDDIPFAMSETDAARFGSFAEAQSSVANDLFAYLRRQVQGRFLFCPTDYCGRMAKPSVAESSYLRELGKRLHPEIDVFWTGPEIVSEDIPVASVLELQRVLKRKPLLWDNLHANDYDLRRLYLGPYAGRRGALKSEVRGVLSNPNNEFEANFVPLKTLANYIHNSDYEPRQAYKEALEAWLPRFGVQGGERITLGDLELLGDLFYLPFVHGARAETTLREVSRILVTAPEGGHGSLARVEETVLELQKLFRKLTVLSNRALLYTVYAYIWELEQEFRYLLLYLAWVSQGQSGSQPEAANTFRDGLAAEIARLTPVKLSASKV